MSAVALPAELLGRLRARCLAVGGAAGALGLVGLYLDPAQFLRSYLLGFVFWASLVLGSLGLLMLHHMVGGAWGFAIRRLQEAAVATLPLLLLMFVPVALGIQELYPWARAGQVAADPLLRHKAPYLNATFFLLRTAGYFAVWIGLATLLNRWSRRQDGTADPYLTRRLQLLSGPGLLVYGLTVSFAGVDWLMSLEPHWFSTIYGLLFMAAQGVGALAFAILLLAPAPARNVLAEVVTPGRLRDLGNLLLTFVMLWAYMAFSQFLIIWYGNLVEEIPWYLHRGGGGWQWVALVLVVLHFFVPFFLLLARRVKQNARLIARIAAAIIVLRLVDYHWLVAPALHPEGIVVHWMDLVLPVGLGAVWLATFVRYLRGKPLLPSHDPRLGDALQPVKGI